ncbi:MAG: hypothetical protein IRZ33_05395 [Alicyclobacillaceae bacterium]|nr:hypothetical protein [Alicyclobacillaceae bacterium]
MDNAQMLEQTIRNYELASEALLAVWDDLSPDELDAVLEKQQHRLKQIADRMYHEERWQESNDPNAEILRNTLERFEMANRHLHANWDAIPFDQRLEILRKQWNRLQQMRERIVH